VPPVPRHELATPLVVSDLRIAPVRRTVDLDDKLHRQAGKVGDKGSDWMLAAKPQPVHRVTPQVLPEDHLGFRQISA
jgi:hypothetical protein